MVGQIQIQTQPSLLAMDSQLASVTIEQPRGELEIEQPRATMDFTQPRPSMEIDQHEAWRAYNGGTALEMSKQIYSSLPSLFLEGLAKRVEQGNQLAQFQIPGNSIAEIYGGDWKRDPFVEFRAAASYDNVSIHVERNRPEINITANYPQIRGRANNPQIGYQPGALNVSVKQYATIQITPPQLDINI